MDLFSQGHRRNSLTKFPVELVYALRVSDSPKTFVVVLLPIFFEVYLSL